MKKSDILLAKIREGQDLTTGDKLSLIISLSIPSILAQMTSTLMFFIDAAMVGSLGAKASAAVGIVETTTWLLGSFTSAMAMGFGVQVAHSIGANDFAKARRIMRTGIITVLCFTVLLCSAAFAVHKQLPFWLGGGADIASDASLYFLIFSLAIPFWQMDTFCMNMLKCAGDMKTPSIVSMLICALDVLYNFLLIYPTRTISILSFDITMPGAGLGVPGAALGTSLAIGTSAFVLSYITFFRSPVLSFKLDKATGINWRPQWKYIRRAFAISAPLALQYTLLNSAQMVSTRIIAPLGNFAIAAHSFAITAESLCYMPGFGIADAATTLVGQSIGAKRIDLCKSLAYRCVGIGMIVMAVMGAVMYIFAPQLMGLMTPVEEIVALGTEALRIEAFAEPMFAAAIVCSSCMVGAGDTIVPAIMNLGSMWGIRLTLAYWLTPTMGLAGAWLAMAVELSFRGGIFLLRLFRGNWMTKTAN